METSLSFPRYVTYKFYDDKYRSVFHKAYDTDGFRMVRTQCGRVLSLDDENINVSETPPNYGTDRMCIACLRAELEMNEVPE